MKKIKLKLSQSQFNALLLMINTAGIAVVITDIEDMAFKEQYTKLFIKLQVRCLSIKEKNNSLKLSLTEAWAIDNLKFYDLFYGFELNTLKYIIREIEQEVINTK